MRSITNMNQLTVKLVLLFNLYNLALSVDSSKVINICTDRVDKANVCTCTENSSQPWGITYLLVQCIDNNFDDTNFNAVNLPLNVEVLSIAWNNFRYIPNFVGKRLRSLELNHNQIESIDEHNFVDVANLTRLDLSHNKIERISLNAFMDLNVLLELDLSFNVIKMIQPNQFSPLVSLNTLKLSNNNLNATFEARRDADLFLTFGVPTTLSLLEMNNCNLFWLNIRLGAGLEKIFLRFNNFSSAPDVPRNVELLDLSGNPFENLTAKFLPHLYRLTTLLLEDMPLLFEVQQYSLFGLPKMASLSLQGSKNLAIISPFAFGANVILNETDTSMQYLNLRGCKLRTLNSSLEFALENIVEMDLSGNPWLCDCEIKWIKNLGIETKVQCVKPSGLRGIPLSEIDDNLLVCSNPNSWMYRVLNGLLVLLLLLLCAGATYLIVMGIRPSRRGQLQKLGAASPYSRITTIPLVLEPNRAENQF